MSREPLDAPAMDSMLGLNGHLIELGAARLLASEPAGDAFAQAQVHVASCTVCAAYLQALRDDDAVRCSSLPPLRLVTAPVSPRPRRTWFVVASTLACAAVLVVWFGRLGGEEHDGVRRKGRVPALQLVVHAHDGRQERPLGPGERVRAGERLGFEVATTDPGYFMIYGIDGTGMTYVCHPQQREAAVYMPAMPTLVALPAAIELDGVSRSESIVGVWCDHPFTLEDARTPRPGCHRVEVPLVKEGG